MTIRFTATADEFDTTLFRTEDDFIRWLDGCWQDHGGYLRSPGRRIPRIQARCLRDPEPTRYPCIMISAGMRELDSGRDEIQNVFLYDVVVHEGDDEFENSLSNEIADMEAAA